MSNASDIDQTIDQDTLITHLFHQVEAVVPDDDHAVARGKAKLLGWMANLPLEQEADTPPASAPTGSPGSERPLNEVRFLNVAEVASMLRVSKMTVYRLVHSGHLPAIRVGRSFRVPQQAVQEYLRESFIDEEIS